MTKRFTLSILVLLVIGMDVYAQKTPVVDIHASGVTEVTSSVEHFKIRVTGKISEDIEGVPDMLRSGRYQIYMLVQPLNATDWYRQNPTPAMQEWEAEAYLGGTGKYAAKDGEEFLMVAILSKDISAAQFGNLGIVLDLPDTHKISDIKRVVTRRP